MGKLVELKRCFDVSEAYAVKGYLASNGIHANVYDENTATTLWHYMVALGGVRVYVAHEDLEEARKLLETIPKTDLSTRPWLPNDWRRWSLFVVFVIFSLPVPLLLFELVKLLWLGISTY